MIFDVERNPDIPQTYQYSQPEEYHFSLDSIEMAWEVFQYLKEKDPRPKFDEWNCLDLCAGCGVLGMELNFHLPQLRKWDFIEVQAVYREHFLENQKLVQAKGAPKPKLSLVRSETLGNPASSTGGDLPWNFYLMNYDQIKNRVEFQKKYQLILANPPYFDPQQGKLSPSEFKNRCRFFLDSTFESLVESIDQSLAMDGEAFLLVRDLEAHQIDYITELKRLCRGRLKCENLGLIRGTFLMNLYR